MSFYLTIFVISDNEATRHILKLALLPQVDRVLGRLLPWLCLEKCSLKCSLWETAGAFTECSNCTIFWGKHTLPFSSRPWGEHWLLFFSCSLILDSTGNEMQWGAVAGHLHEVQIKKGHWDPGNMVSYQLAGRKKRSEGPVTLCVQF